MVRKIEIKERGWGGVDILNEREGKRDRVGEK